MSKKEFFIKKCIKICKKWDLNVPSRINTLGRLGELLAYDYLKCREINTEILSFSEGAKYDALANKKKIEIKTALARDKKYNLTFVKNKTKGKCNFDFIIAVLFPNLESEPKFLLFKRNKIKHLTGISGNLSKLIQLSSSIYWLEKLAK